MRSLKQAKSFNFLLSLQNIVFKRMLLLNGVPCSFTADSDTSNKINSDVNCGKYFLVHTTENREESSFDVQMKKPVTFRLSR